MTKLQLCQRLPIPEFQMSYFLSAGKNFHLVSPFLESSLGCNQVSPKLVFHIENNISVKVSSFVIPMNWYSNRHISGTLNYHLLAFNLQISSGFIFDFT